MRAGITAARRSLPRPGAALTRRPAPGVGNPTLVLFLVAVAAASVSTAAALSGRWPVAAAATVNGLALYTLYTVTHEAVHGTAHPAPGINRWLGRIAAALEGTTFPLFRLLHLQHHAFTNDPRRDPDAVVGRTPRWLLPLWLLVRLTCDNAFAQRHRLWTHRRRERLEHVVTVGAQAAAVGAALACGQGRLLLALWVLPLVAAGALLQLTVAWLVHYPHASPHPLEATRQFPGRLWFVLTLGQNHHLVHHLWTTIPWYRYAAAADLAAGAMAAHRAARAGEGAARREE